MTTTDAPETAPKTGYPLERLVVPALVFLAIAISYGQIVTGIGKSPQDFSADGDSTLRAASFAFSIWGVIFAWLTAFAVFQALPGRPESRILKRLRWPAAAGLFGVSLWVVFAAMDLKWLTVLVLAATTSVLLAPMVIAPKVMRETSLLKRGLSVWPLAFLAGWGTIATVLNLITTATALEQLPTGAPPFVWAVLGIAVLVAVTLAVTARIRLWAYPAPVAWGLVGVFSAEQADGDALLAIIALGAAFALAILSAFLLARVWVFKARTPNKAEEPSSANDAPTAADDLTKSG